MESFNYFLEDGMELAVDSMEPIVIQHPLTKIDTRFWFEQPSISKPIKEDSGIHSDNRLFPSECREAGLTYKVCDSWSFLSQKYAHKYHFGTGSLYFEVLLADRGM